MKKLNKKIAILLSGALVCSMLTACGGGQETKTAETTKAAAQTTAAAAQTTQAAAQEAPASGEAETITVWHSMSGKNGEVLTAIVDAYNASQTNYNVVMEYQGSYEDTVAKLQSTPEGIRPDVVQLGEVNTCWMAYSDYYVPVQDYLDAAGVDVSDYQEAILGFYSIDGRLLSMPFNSSVPCIIYNATLLEQAGIDPETLDTLDGVMAASRAIVDQGLARYGTCFNGEGFVFENYFSMLGADMTDNDNGRSGVPTKLIIDENGSAEKLFTAWLDFVSDDSAISFGGDSSAATEGKKETSAGNVAMYIGSCGAYSSIKSGAAGVYEMGIRALPKISESDPYSLTVGGASFWILNNGEATKGDGAFDFIRFTASPEMQAMWASSTGYLPVSKSAQVLDEYQAFLAETPGFDTVLAAMSESNADSAGPLMGVSNKWRSVLGSELQMMMDDSSYTVQEAIESICYQINDEIALYNEANGLN